MNLERVTVTGADDSVNVVDLIEISQEFPFVEFGILLSKSQVGRPRFPSVKWLTGLADANEFRSMRTAGHVCGSYVREILIGIWPRWAFYGISPKFQDSFTRWQINTHALPHEVKFSNIPFILRELEAKKQSVIFQYDGVNDHLVYDAKLAGCDNVAALFDLSHGAGCLPESWPKPIPGVFCGYAGGLSPENITEQIERVGSVIGDATIWIDAETHLRSDNNRFDLDKAARFLEAAAPWIVNDPKRPGR